MDKKFESFLERTRSARGVSFKSIGLQISGSTRFHVCLLRSVGKTYGVSSGSNPWRCLMTEAVGISNSPRDMLEVGGRMLCLARVKGSQEHIFFTCGSTHQIWQGTD